MTQMRFLVTQIPRPISLWVAKLCPIDSGHLNALAPQARI
jgi:hypothetical protein